MKKEVFTQEFDKCFTVFQQVQLMKKFLSELDISTGDTSDKLSTTKSFTDTKGNIYNGLVNWSTENDTLSYETKIYSNVLKDFSTYFYMGDDNIIMDNHYAHIGIEKDTLDIHCDVGNKYSITGTVSDDNSTEINIKADRLLHNGEPIGGAGTDAKSYSHYVEITCETKERQTIYVNFNITLNVETLTIESLTNLLQSNPEYKIPVRNISIYNSTDLVVPYSLGWDTTTEKIVVFYTSYHFGYLSNLVTISIGSTGKAKSLKLVKDVVMTI